MALKADEIAKNAAESTDKIIIRASENAGYKNVVLFDRTKRQTKPDPEVAAIS